MADAHNDTIMAYWDDLKGIWQEGRFDGQQVAFIGLALKAYADTPGLTDEQKEFCKTQGDATISLTMGHIKAIQEHYAQDHPEVLKGKPHIEHKGHRHG
jgi:hypothetical protein